MSFKRMLFVISCVIVVMFALMLSTSYAWYSFEKGSTTFDTTTSNDVVNISFVKGEYINNVVGVPINKSDIDKYSDKHQFIVKSKNNKDNNQLLLKISLVDIVIDKALGNVNFLVDLYYQGEKISTVTGEELVNNNDSTMLLDSVVMDNDIDNNFEVRVYLLDDNSNQSDLMGKSFSAKIQVDVVSRLKTTVTNWDNTDIYISSVTIDGKSSNHLPVDGYYVMSFSCQNGSSLSWDGYSKTLSYEMGSKINDSCSLTFKSATSNKLLNTVSVGSYVKYEGNNGCSGNACKGENANYVSDKDMGYCGSANNKFVVNGWRVAYISDDSVYLVSAGAIECLELDNTSIDDTSGKASDKLNDIALGYCNSSYSYDGKCDSNSVWSISDSDYQMILKGNGLASCKDSYGNKGCGYNNDLIDNGGFSWYIDNSLVYYWNSLNRGISVSSSSFKAGVRPVIRLRSDVIVVSGSGSYEDAYVIK